MPTPGIHRQYHVAELCELQTIKSGQITKAAEDKQ